ncbi:hypothetical protein KL942_005004 [Ogataea angusta]|uniref:Ubiquitin-like 1-activating enzyme E1A n=1 Tax=Pichia angusta TaxID=870730 RepID=A0ABQ7RR37_PICAN|nr:hypothetical protein KL942_005004 [Ogataea angusta]KAG7846029.1 hypothetical protein KL940_004868 [Ogataea angusta]
MWGIEAQTRMRGSRVLVVNLTSVGCEIVKNLMLGGIGAITVIDSFKVLDQDLNANFFIDKTQVGQPKVLAAEARIRDLNPRVNLTVSTDNWQEKPKDFFLSYNLVVATGLDKTQLTRLNAITRKLKIPFYATGTHGLYGYIFVDLIEHESSVKYEKYPTPKKVGPLSPTSDIVSISEVVENDVELQNCIVKTKFVPLSDIFTNNEKLKFYFPTPRKLKKISPVLPILLALLEIPSQIGKPIEDVAIDAKELSSKVAEVVSRLELPEEIIRPDLVGRLAQQAFCEFQPGASAEQLCGP